ncbi:hypothetical protein M407DRAFT_10013 [Tulasnella calospora MUT 4182]|uniref:F-box domain-containing protein n=1 Tax=Tulasnella calospora MUT 4182 TaxID=1051891 RepID=A0A0C3QCG0_9AGAM|nr:hypothetical protein M407DRAFT_10013 [Tulasnella calospora MUT 4182]
MPSLVEFPRFLVVCFLAFGRRAREFGDLDKRIEFAEQSLKEAYLLLISHVTAANRQRNALLPIFKLPTEILGTILEMTCDLDTIASQIRFADQEPNHVEHLLNLGAVSSRFLSVVIGTAALWAVADWRCSPSQVKRCLERSRGALITVEYDWRAAFIGSRTMVPTWWVDSFISEHIARWREVDLVFGSESLPDVVALLSGGAAPLLRMVVVYWVESRETVGKAIHLFGGNAPNLTIIDLRGIHVHWEWDPNIIANLRSLVLCGVLISKASVGSFLSLIQSSMLEKLAIRRLRLDGTADLTPVSPSWLNRLKEISIMDVHYDVFRYFFGTIRAPHIQSAAVHFLHDLQVGTKDWGQLLLHCLSSIPQNVEQALHIELYFDYGAVQISLLSDVGPPVLVNLRAGRTVPDLATIDWVIESILVYRKRSTFSVRFSGYPEEYIREILPSLLRLTDVTGVELELAASAEWALSAGWTAGPWFLSCPVPKASGKQWLWPELTNVTVHGRGWEGVGDYILLIVKGRLEASSSSCDWDATCENEEQGRPVPIQSVRIKDVLGLPRSEAEQLENLVQDIELPSPERLVAHAPAFELLNFVEWEGSEFSGTTIQWDELSISSSSDQL